MMPGDDTAYFFCDFAGRGDGERGELFETVAYPSESCCPKLTPKFRSQLILTILSVAVAAL